MQNVRGHVRNAPRPFVRLMGNLVVSYEYQEYRQALTGVQCEKCSAHSCVLPMLPARVACVPY